MTISFDNIFGGKYGPNINKTPLKNAETLKKMTIGQLLDSFHLKDDVYERYLTGLRKDAKRDKDVRDENAYSVLMDIYLDSSSYRDRLEIDPDMPQEEKDRGMIDLVRNNYFRRGESASRRLHTMEMYQTTRSPEEKRSFPLGTEIINADFSKEIYDKHIKKELDSTQVSEELDPIVEQGRTQRFKEKLQYFDGQLKKAQQPLNMEQKEPYAQMFPKIDRSEKSYDNYIRLHSGVYAMDTRQDYQEVLSKVLAAKTLKESGQPFSVKRIRHMAKSIKELPAIRSLKNDEIVRALSTDPQALKDMQQTIYLKSFDVKEGGAVKYIDDMKKLQTYMMSSKERSPEYQKFAEAVGNVAKLDPHAPNFADASQRANESLLKAINIYSQGKEKVRFQGDGVLRFNNTMDALSIMKDNIPGIKNVIDSRVSAINKKRKAEDAADRDHLDLGSFGAENARREYMKRTKARPADPEAEKGGMHL